MTCRAAAGTRNGVPCQERSTDLPSPVGDAVGPSLGQYQGHPIPAYITDDGMRLFFLRVAHEDQFGDVDLDQLRDQEVLISPGLIYGP